MLRSRLPDSIRPSATSLEVFTTSTMYFIGISRPSSLLAHQSSLRSQTMRSCPTAENLNAPEPIGFSFGLDSSSSSDHSPMMCSGTIMVV